MFVSLMHTHKEINEYEKNKSNISIVLLFTICFGIFCQCDKKSNDEDELCKFDFPINNTLDSAVYAEMKQTCERYWDLCSMIDTTFEVVTDRDEYSIHCDGFVDNVLYSFTIRVDKDGKWINNGRTLKT